MPNKENIKKHEFKKGESGNPNGRPKLKNPLTGEKETMSQEDLMTLALIKKAREGDVSAYKALMDSGYGAPVQQVEQTNIELPFFDLNETEENNGTSKDS
jgi:hypothetical protein